VGRGSRALIKLSCVGWRSGAETQPTSRAATQSGSGQAVRVRVRCGGRGATYHRQKKS